MRRMIKGSGKGWSENEAGIDEFRLVLDDDRIERSPLTSQVRW